jgi:hypothetical protein
MSMVRGLSRRLMDRLITGLISGAILAWPSYGEEKAAPIPDLSPDSNTRWLAVGQDFLPPPSGPGPVTFDKAHPYVTNPAAATGGGQPTFRIADLTNPILTPWAAEQMDRANDEVLKGKVAFTSKSTCWPGGVPGVLLYGAEPMFFIQTPKEVWMLWEFDHQVRHVYLNQPHSAHPAPSWYGESIGHYEGDTLVVDTIGLNDKTMIDNYRTPHTDKLHVVERFRLADGGRTLEANVTIDDRGAFTMPWSAVQRWRRQQGPLIEDACAENIPDYFGFETVPIPRAETPDF